MRFDSEMIRSFGEFGWIEHVFVDFVCIFFTRFPLLLFQIHLFTNGKWSEFQWSLSYRTNDAKTLQIYRAISMNSTFFIMMKMACNRSNKYNDTCISTTIVNWSKRLHRHTSKTSNRFDELLLCWIVISFLKWRKKKLLLLISTTIIKLFSFVLTLVPLKRW